LAQQALNSGDFKAARIHLNAAVVNGCDRQLVAQIEKQIDYAEHHRHDRAHQHTVIALCIAVVGYSVLAAQTPSGWTYPVWASVSLLVLPAIQGVVLFAGAHDDYGALERFRNGWILGFITMGGYTFFSLNVLNSRVESHTGDSGFPILFLTVLYGLAAGLVCGLVSLVMSKRAAR